MESNFNDEDLPVDTGKNPIGRPVGSKKKKFNAQESRAFVNKSARVILDLHMSYVEYLNWCKETEGIGKSQGNEYWLKVWSLIRKKFDMEKDKLILKHTMKYWDIYDQAITNRDLTNARGALNDLAKLAGLNEPDKVEVRGTSIKLNFGNSEDNG